MPQRYPIFVLTLADAEARRQPLISKLRSLGLDFELFHGIDGRQGLPASFEAMIDRSARITNKRRRMTDGEFACALSHLAIYRLLIERRLDRALILEDDAIVGTAFAALAEGRMRWAGALMLLDHLKGYWDRREECDIHPGYCGLRVRIAPFLATGYGITRDGARYMLDNAYPVRSVADWPCDITRLSCFAVSPRIVDHPEEDISQSHLKKERDEAGNPKSRHALWTGKTVTKLTSLKYHKRKLIKIFNEEISENISLDLK